MNVVCRKHLPRDRLARERLLAQCRLSRVGSDSFSREARFTKPSATCPSILYSPDRTSKFSLVHKKQKLEQDKWTLSRKLLTNICYKGTSDCVLTSIYLWTNRRNFSVSKTNVKGKYPSKIKTNKQQVSIKYWSFLRITNFATGHKPFYKRWTRQQTIPESA